MNLLDGLGQPLISAILKTIESNNRSILTEGYRHERAVLHRRKPIRREGLWLGWRCGDKALVVVSISVCYNGRRDWRTAQNVTHNFSRHQDLHFKATPIGSRLVSV